MKKPKQRAEDPRVRIFICEYIQDFNATRAYKAAGYSENGARQSASRLLANADIRCCIAELLKELCDSLMITKERVLRETALLAFANMADYLTPQKNGELMLDFSELTRDQAAAIQEIKQDTTGGTGDGERKRVVRTTFRLASKKDALELLGKHLGIFKDRVELGGPNGDPVSLRVEFVKPAGTLKQLK
jgi:phage terminase small subunit